VQGAALQETLHGCLGDGEFCGGARFNKDNAADPLPRIRLHDLRHTWAVLAMRAGIHPKVVSDRLGHTTTNITLNIYSHVVEGMQTQAAENVSAAIFGGAG
jgi:integrase